MSFLRRAWNRICGYQPGGYANPPAEEPRTPTIIFNGEFWHQVGDIEYHAEKQPDGTWTVYRNNDYHGTYPQGEIDRFLYLDDWTIHDR